MRKVGTLLLMLVLAGTSLPGRAAPRLSDSGAGLSASSVASAFSSAVRANPYSAPDLGRAAAARFAGGGSTVGGQLRAQRSLMGLPDKTLPVAPSGTLVLALDRLRSITATPSHVPSAGDLAEIESALGRPATRALAGVVDAVAAGYRSRAGAFRTLGAAGWTELAGKLAAVAPYRADGRASSLLAGARQADLKRFLARLAVAARVDAAAIMAAAVTLGDAIDVLSAALRASSLPSAHPARRGSPSIATVPTPLGDIVVKGTSGDINDEQALLLIDLGGNDTYNGTIASATGTTGPTIRALLGGSTNPPLPNPATATQTRIVVDVSGADTYNGGSKTQGFGEGGGFGILLDAGSDNDAYRAIDYAQGAGLLGGVGVLVDGGGANTYLGSTFTQGFSQASGVGLLASGIGNDTYTSYVFSQGTGFDGGAGGTLVDLGGNDRYGCTGTVNTAAVILPVSQTRPSTGCHGTGFGGQGAQIDVAGNDIYTVATSFQNMTLIGGGLLVDGGGTDVFDAGEWSHGFAALGTTVLVEGTGTTTYSSRQRVGPWADIFIGSNGEGYVGGVGVLADSTGSDTYLSDVDKATFLPQFASGSGCGYDGGVGVLVDGQGDDRYTTETGAGGAFSSYGALIDGSGNDTYSLTYGSIAGQGYAALAPYQTGLGVLSCAVAYLVDAEGSDSYSNTVVDSGARGNGRYWLHGTIGRGMDGNGIASYAVQQAATDLQTYVNRRACVGLAEQLI